MESEGGLRASWVPDWALQCRRGSAFQLPSPPFTLLKGWILLFLL